MEKIKEHLGLSGMLFDSEYKFTKQQLAEFFEIDERTIERYLSTYENELKHNGYVVMKGKSLKEFKAQFGHLMNESNKTTQLGLFNFRALLNFAMLISESEKAKALRGAILDIVIDTINQRLGGSTKYINQRDEEFFQAIIREPHYRKSFTSALHECIDMGNYKYAYYTDKIYTAIFQENAKEYKKLLQIEDKENPRDTMYAEILNLIASFENGLAHEMQKKCQELGRKLSSVELDKIFKDFSEHPAFKPLIENARIQMASRDYGFRKVLHENLQEYVRSITQSDYQRFLGEKSKDLVERIEENLDVFKRLKDR